MRVIQDSEDEDGIEIDEAEPVAPEQHGQSNASPKPGENDTGSTDTWIHRAARIVYG